MRKELIIGIILSTILIASCASEEKSVSKENEETVYKEKVVEVETITEELHKETEEMTEEVEELENDVDSLLNEI